MFDIKRNVDGLFDIRNLNVNLVPGFWKNTFSFDKNGITYFLKEKGYSEALKEMVAAEIADMYKLEHADYDMCLCDGIISSVSKNIALDGEEYLALFDVIYSDDNDLIGLPDNYNNVDDMRNIIMPALKITNIEDEIRKYINIMLFDITTANDDRNGMNIGFIKDINGYRVSPIFDNGNIATLRTINEHNYKQGLDREDSRFRRYGEEPREDLLVKIITNYTDTYGKDLKDYVEYLTDEKIDLAFNIVEEKIGAKVSPLDKISIKHNLQLNRDNILDMMRPFYLDVKTYKKVK